MKFSQVKESLIALLEDAEDAENFLEKNPELQFARRTYIRSIFASIEGIVWILKDACLNAKLSSGISRINASEFALLREEGYELKNNGETKVTSKFLRLPENVKFTFKIINKLFGSEIQLDVGGKNWEDFIKAIEVRHRITHPRNKDSFLISDDEIEFCKIASGWFNDVAHEAVKIFLKSID